VTYGDGRNHRDEPVVASRPGLITSYARQENPVLIQIKLSIQMRMMGFNYIHAATARMLLGSRSVHRSD